MNFLFWIVGRIYGFNLLGSLVVAGLCIISYGPCLLVALYCAIFGHPYHFMLTTYLVSGPPLVFAISTGYFLFLAMFLPEGDEERQPDIIDQAVSLAKVKMEVATKEAEESLQTRKDA